MLAYFLVSEEERKINFGKLRQQWATVAASYM